MNLRRLRVPRRPTALAPAVLAAVVLALGALTSCAGTAGTAVAGCVDTAPPGVPGHAKGAAPLITVRWGSFWTRPWEMTESAVVYTDGSAIFRAVPDAQGDQLRINPDASTPPAPTGLVGLAGGYLPACELNALLGELDAIPAGADFGMPDIMDAPGVTVTVTPAAGPATSLSAYALGIGDEKMPSSARALRHQLSAALDHLDGAFRSTGPVPIDRIRVMTVAEGSGPGLTSQATLDWRGPSLDALLKGPYSCGELTADAAAGVAAALPPGEHGGYLGSFRAGGREVVLGLLALAPGVDGCRT